MKVLILIGLFSLASCSLLSGKEVSPVEDYIQKLKSARNNDVAPGPRYIEIPVPQPRS